MPPYYDPFAEYRMHGAPRSGSHRNYAKPYIVRQPRNERYNAERDMYQTARFVVGGMVVVGTLGLFGSIINK